LIDGGEGDRFFLSGNFHASGGVLGVDAFLGPPGSIADVFQVENDVTGETALRVNNTSPFGGALNQDGIVVVEVLGNVQPNAFFLENGPSTPASSSMSCSSSLAPPIFSSCGAARRARAPSSCRS
jgi:outer membrane autotransporter protein